MVRLLQAMLFLFLLAFSAQAQNPYYYLNRSFSSVPFDLQGIPTEYQLNEESDKLTDIVEGSIQLNSNETYAIEKQTVIAVGHGSALSAWNAVVATNATTSNYPGKIFDNVGWVRGTDSAYGKWGAYLWGLQNRIEFQASTSAWWSTTNGIPVAITNVMVGSLGDYQATSNVVDIGPNIPLNYPGANHCNIGVFQVDITNVYYELIIPDIWIMPREAYAAVGGSNVEFAVSGTNIPQGVTWSLIPDLSGSGGATFQTNGAWQAEIIPGNVGTNYIVRATSKVYTNFCDQVSLAVCRVDIVESNVYVGVTNTTSLHLTPESSANVQWEITPDLQNGASIQGSSVGTSIVFNAGSVPTNYMVRAYIVELTNCYDTCTVTVLKVDLIQAGLDCTDTNKAISLQKTGSDTYTNDMYYSNGDTAIVNPVWQDLDMNDVPDVNPPDPVCFVKNAMPKIVQGKLHIEPDLGTEAVDAKLKIEATPIGAAGELDNLVFESETITLTSSNVTFPAIVEDNSKTVGSVVNNFKYAMAWSISLDNGANWQLFQTMTQQVFVVYDNPQSNYCSNVNYWSLPYSWSSLAVTAQRMDWATQQSMGENTGDGMAIKLTESINNNPGPPPPGDITNVFYENPFEQLDTPDPYQSKMCHRGDCISLANLAATALRLLGTNACPSRAYCNNSNDVSNSETWGWVPRHIHPVHNDWFLGYPGNNFEGFFYYGVADPPASSNFPSKGWTVWPVRSVTMNAGKEKYLPIAILSNVPVSQLQWQVEDKPDVEWVSNAISGVLVNQDPATVHCTNWVIGADGPCSIEWDTNSLSLTLDSGEAVDVIVDGWYSLSCSNGAISVTNSMAQLPGSNQTGTVSIVPARMLAPVP